MLLPDSVGEIIFHCRDHPDFFNMCIVSVPIDFLNCTALLPSSRPSAARPRKIKRPRMNPPPLFCRFMEIPHDQPVCGAAPENLRHSGRCGKFRFFCRDNYTRIQYSIFGVIVPVFCLPAGAMAGPGYCGGEEPGLPLVAAPGTRVPGLDPARIGQGVEFCLAQE